MDAPGTVARGDLLVRDGVIAAVGDGVPAALAALPGRRADESVDASGAFVLPGFVHGHLHLCQTLFRGLAEQSDLLRWLREGIWPLEALLTETSIAASARLGLLELIAGGVTCVNDMGTVRHTDAIGRVLEASGIRAVFGKALMDRGAGVPPALCETPRAALESALELARRWDGAAGGRLRVSLAPRFILTCSHGLWRDVAAASAERGLLVHTHLAESPGEAREVEAAVSSTRGPLLRLRRRAVGALRRRARRVGGRRGAGHAGAGAARRWCTARARTSSSARGWPTCGAGCARGSSAASAPTARPATTGSTPSTR